MLNFFTRLSKSHRKDIDQDGGGLSKHDPTTEEAYQKSVSIKVRCPIWQRKP